MIQGVLTSILNGMEVVPMRNQDNKHFDFKDIIAFAMFILALLTFIFNFCK